MIETKHRGVSEGLLLLLLGWTGVGGFFEGEGCMQTQLTHFSFDFETLLLTAYMPWTKCII